MNSVRSVNAANALTLPRDALMPRAPGGMRRGLALAIVAHLLLVAALSFSVNWHSSTPDAAAEAELWAAVPQIAAPRAAEPPPPPPQPPQPQAPPRTERVATPPPIDKPAARELPDAQIALERERERREQKRLDEQRRTREQAEKDRAQRAVEAADKARQQARLDAQRDQAKLDAQREQVKQQQAAQQTARQVAAQAERLETQRQENLKRIIGQAGGAAPPTRTGTAAQSAGPSADYIGRIRGRIRPNVVFPNTLPGNPAVEIDIRMSPDGHIISKRVTRPSGAPEWDDAVLRAIEKTEVLPRDENGRVPAALTIVYRPND